MTKKFETVCIKRGGFDILHTSGVDGAATVTYHCWIPGEVYVPCEGVRSFWIVPKGRPGDYAE
jgi:hypothetical protein